MEEFGWPPGAAAHAVNLANDLRSDLERTSTQCNILRRNAVAGARRLRCLARSISTFSMRLALKGARDCTLQDLVARIYPLAYIGES